MSDSEELLMTSRSRRQNAGNKMQKLLEQERQEMQEKTAGLDDDEINLLFQEEEDDAEFEVELKRKRDDDDVFTESEEESDNQDDEDAGERELERQEKKKRKLALKRKIPVIRKRVVDEKKLKPQYVQPKADSLLLDSRRTSTRRSVIANKLQVYEKLALAEKKRKQIQDRLRKSRETQEEKTLTQEDRLRIAEETERLNLQSLNKFREQEIYQKQTRIAMQQRRKIKFAVGEIVMRINSLSWSVTPAMEVKDREYWDQQLAKRHKKKRYTRRRKTVKEDPKSTAKEADDPSAVSQNGSIANEEVKSEQAPIGDSRSPDTEDDASKSSDPQTEVQGQAGEAGDKEISQNVSSSQAREEQMNAADAASSLNSSVVKKTAQNAVNGPDADNKQADDSNTTRQGKKVAFADVGEVPQEQTTILETLPSAECDLPEFADMDDSKRGSSKEETPGSTEPSTPEEVEEIYEGPEQLVGRNFLTLYSYPHENLRVSDLNSYILGPQWAQPLNSRSADVETLVKIVNPSERLWAENEDEFNILDMSILDRFPAFGEFDKVPTKEIVEETDKHLDLELKTPAPTGVFLPNGLRKKCMMTNRDCQYFDPKNGVPYSDVEAYKTVQELQDPIGDGGTSENPLPRFKWFGFARGGIYLDVRRRPAKGVPEGF
ncbi:LAMI_0B06678g1_1 [Lachancea mirantina]|uniref:LAMI_0B06678g1_1 n=1 Tax=Lachancea mirantina TaxID=1230905 RepID=A0A1G4IWS1_9SACH|nr:LAMI_0B06678g1_1 [Lachancea mirantina]